jgi:hypothetical protein
MRRPARSASGQSQPMPIPRPLPARVFSAPPGDRGAVMPVCPPHIRGNAWISEADPLTVGLDEVRAGGRGGYPGAACRPLVGPWSTVRGPTPRRQRGHPDRRRLARIRREGKQQWRHLGFRWVGDGQEGQGLHPCPHRLAAAGHPFWPAGRRQETVATATVLSYAAGTLGPGRVSRGLQQDSGQATGAGAQWSDP